MTYALIALGLVFAIYMFVYCSRNDPDEKLFKETYEQFQKDLKDRKKNG